MRKKRFLVDVDGVLSDFCAHAFKLMEKITGRPVPPGADGDWDIFAWMGDPALKDACYDIIKGPGWCAEIPVYPGAREGVDALREVGDVYFCTSPTHGPYWYYERAEWLMHHFGAKRNHIIHAVDKHVCAGDVLVDDKPEHVFDWLDHHPNGYGVLWLQPYNKLARHPTNLDVDLRVIRTCDWGIVRDLHVR